MIFGQGDVSVLVQSLNGEILPQWFKFFLFFCFLLRGNVQ